MFPTRGVAARPLSGSARRKSRKLFAEFRKEPDGIVPMPAIPILPMGGGRIVRFKRIKAAAPTPYRPYLGMAGPYAECPDERARRLRRT